MDNELLSSGSLWFLILVGCIVGVVWVLAWLGYEIVLED